MIDITARLRQGECPSEQSISQGVVVQVLQEPGRPVCDPAAARPECQSGDGRADFAGCHPPPTPAGFVEGEPPGRAADGVRPALEQAFQFDAASFRDSPMQGPAR